MSPTFALAAYRTRVALARQRGAYLSIVLLTALLGGLSMGAFTAARATESSMTQLVRVENVPDLFVLDGFYNPTVGLNSGYNPGLLQTIAHLPHVRQVTSEVGISAGPVTPEGHVPRSALGLSLYGSVDGFDFTMNRVFVVRGRIANPHAADEFMTDPTTARELGLHLGESVNLGYVTNVQSLTLNGSTRIPSSQRFRATLVGIATSPFMSLFQDASAPASNQSVLFTPALTRRMEQCCANDMISGISIQGGARYDTAVEAELRAVLPKGVPFTVITTASQEATAGRTLRPDAIALDVFGGIATLALILILGQAIVRRASSRVEELAVMRALGASPAMTTADDLAGTVGAIVVGILGAVVVALALSTLAPLGPVRPYLPTGIHADATVLVTGCLAMLVVLTGLALGAARRWEPRRDQARVQRHAPRVARRVARSPLVDALPVSAVTGIRFALDPGAGRNRVPVRSAVVGAALAMAVVAANLTFGASLTSLVSHPALFGWNWSLQIDGGGGLGDIPQHQSADLLNADRLVAGWSGYYFSALKIDGLDVPVMGGSPNAAVGPAILSGHAVDAANQVVLGVATLAQLGRSVGQTVTVSSGRGPASRLTIVGTATLPSIGVAGSTHLEMGSGAVLSYHLIPPSARNPFDTSRPGPNAILVRLRPGVSLARGRRSLEAIGAELKIATNGGSVFGVQRPAEIINYATLGSTPDLLGAALAAGAAIGLAMTLVTLVRRRRYDLALLKTLGFTRRQVASTIAWQSSVDVGLGCLIGLPLGVLAGRYLWDLFARGIFAVPRPAVPVGTVLIVAVVALALANVAAAIPARLAARTPTALLLRSE